MIQVWRIWCECCGCEEVIKLDTEIDGDLCTTGMCTCGTTKLSGKYHIEKVAEYGTIKDFK